MIKKKKEILSIPIRFVVLEMYEGTAEKIMKKKILSSIGLTI